MGFHYASEKKKFDRQWVQLKKEYSSAGMEQNAITAMQEYDWTDFKKERVFRTHNQAMPAQIFSDDGDIADDGKSALLHRFTDRFSDPPMDTDPSRRYSWVDEIGNPSLAKRLQRLHTEDLELLTLYVFEDRTQQEIAKKMMLTQQTVSYRISRVKKSLQFS